MIDVFSLLQDTVAYKTVMRDKKSDRLSHAYLLLSQDGETLKDYLTVFAKLIACKNSIVCNECRSCRLIDENAHPDVSFYPTGASVVVEDVEKLISDSYVKPIESDKRVFVILNGQTMNLSAQNKLLKTLEEPPNGVHILIGATSEFPLLSTLKSRVKKLEIPTFSKDKLYQALSGIVSDSEMLKKAIACGDGTVGKALSLYNNENLFSVLILLEDLLINMKSSADVLDYCNRIEKSQTDIVELLSVLELLLRDMLVLSQGKKELVANDSAEKVLKEASNFSTGAIIHALEKTVEALERKKFNANPTMLIEWLLFQILEGKYKWQKL